MNINYVTCSGVNETTDIPALIALAEKFPIAEFGIQVSQEKCSYSSARFKWLNDLSMYAFQQNVPLNIALHVNRSWAEDCGQGKKIPELGDLLDLTDCTGNFFVKRVQLNFKIGRDQTPDEQALEDFIESLDPIRCILSYNDSNRDLIERLYWRGVLFDCLYDNSFGEGIVPKTREAPAFPDVVQGYAGGISPQNVTAVLNQIYRKWKKKPSSTGIYLDAEGKLKGTNNHCDLAKCQSYLENALAWRDAHS